MTLFINTTDFNNLQFAIINQNTIKEFTATIAFNENYKTNAYLEKFLKKHKLVPSDITKIIVCTGPGSFTGIRVGVAMAQALSFALSIPLLTVTKNKVPADLTKLLKLKSQARVTLNYGLKPNIGKLKK